MSRPLRLEFSGAFYHVTSRGDRCEAIYLDDRDRKRFVDLLAAVCDQYNWGCHAYCLMSNHYHVVLETPEANLSQGMRQLNGVYTQWFNNRHGKVGHVFQGRYKAIVVDKDSYLLELSRYVVLNPVRAGLVETAGQWPWSSYWVTIGQVRAPRWLVVNAILNHFSKDRCEAQRRYIRFVSQGVTGSNIWSNLKQQLYLGDEQFVKRVQAHLGSSESIQEVPRAQRRPVAESLARYATEEVDARCAMKRAYASGYYTLKEIANYFGVHYSTVSRVVKSRS